MQRLVTVSTSFKHKLLQIVFSGKLKQSRLLHQGQFRLGIRKGWSVTGTGCPGEVVRAPSLPEFKERLDNALSQHGGFRESCEEQGV